MITLSPLEVADWDFSGVPDDELIGCCYWEYSRESDFICQTLRSYREWFLSGGSRNEQSDRLFASMDRIQSIGDISEVIIRGCSLPAAAVWQSENELAPHYRHPEADPITGSFPAPWQSLSREERACRAHRAKHGTRLHSPPIERADYYEAEDIAKYHRARVNNLLKEYREIQTANPSKSEVQLIEEGKLKPFPDVPSSLFWESGREVTVLRINWSDYTNDQLTQYFRRWVKTHRPPQIPVPSGRGRKPGDWRAHLTRLGVMRLLGRFTPSQILQLNGRIAKLVRRSKQFAKSKWRDSTKWHDARREASKVFSSMFPFLPPDEIPRSWTRVTPKKEHGV
jgi:hypothetical protein